MRFVRLLIFWKASACVALSCVVLFASGCGVHERQPVSRGTIRIATFSKAFGNAPYHIARHFRWFETDPALAGYTIAYAEYTDRNTISQAFSRGDLQVLFSGDAPAILCRAQGNDIRAIALSGNAPQEILVPKTSAISTVSALKGKTVAVQAGTSSHYALLKVLREFGLKEGDVNLRLQNTDEARSAFEANSIDAWAVWAPFVEQEQVRGTGKVIPGGSALINSIMSVDGKFLRNNDTQTRAIVAVVNRAKKWMLQNPDESKRIIASELGYQREVVNMAWPKFNWSATMDSAVEEDLQQKADFLTQQQQTRQGRRIDIKSDFVDQKFVTNVTK